MKMSFERLVESGCLWAVRYDRDEVNIFEKVFSNWNDYKWLRTFFSIHQKDLADYFHIVNLDQAVYDTVDDANNLESLILDLNPDSNLDELFRPLENKRASETVLSREKAKGSTRKHTSWLRLYAIRLESGHYIITGGAIKLTATMQERAHTLLELNRLNQVRDYLIEQGISDFDGFKEYNNEGT